MQRATRAKFVLSNLQIAAASGAIQDTPWGEEVRRAFMFINLLSLDASQALPWQCLFTGWDYRHSVALTCALPAAWISLITVAGALLRRCSRPLGLSRQRLSALSWTAALFVMFLCYPAVAARLFAYFRCESFDDGSLLLHADPSLPCRGAAYLGFLPVVIVLTVIYVAGIPCLFAVLLLRQYYAVRQPSISDATRAIEARNKVVTLAHLRFLFAPYKPRWFLTEIIELLRKLLLTSVLVLFSPSTYDTAFSIQAVDATGVRGSAVQSLVSLLTLLFFIIAYAATRPLVRRSDGVAFLVTLAQLFVVLLLGFALKVDVVRRDLEASLGGTRVVSSLSLLAVLSVCVVLFIDDGTLHVMERAAAYCVHLARRKKKALVISGSGVTNPLHSRAELPVASVAKAPTQAAVPGAGPGRGHAVPVAARLPTRTQALPAVRSGSTREPSQAREELRPQKGRVDARPERQRYQQA